MRSSLLLLLLLAPQPLFAGESRLVAMSPAETLRYVWLEWSVSGRPWPVRLEPVENLSVRDSGSPQGALAGESGVAERGVVPVPALDALWRSLVQASGLFRPVSVADGVAPAYRLRLVISDYRPRFASALLGWPGAVMEWGKLLLAQGEDEAQAAVRLYVLPPEGTAPLYAYELRGSLCRIWNFTPLVATGTTHDAFLNTWGRTAIGQTVHALMNRGLAELADRMKPARPGGEVLSVARGEVLLALASAAPGDRLELRSAGRDEPLGELTVLGGEAGRYRAQPRDIPVAAIVAGDSVLHRHAAPQALYSRLPHQPSQCAPEGHATTTTNTRAPRM